MVDKMAKKSNSKFVGGLLLGSMIGAMVGVLMSPRTGKETRKIIKKSTDALPQLAEDLASTIKLKSGKWSQNTRQKWQGTLNRLQDAIAAGIEASQREGKKEEFKDKIKNDIETEVDILNN